MAHLGRGDAGPGSASAGFPDLPDPSADRCRDVCDIPPALMCLRELVLTANVVNRMLDEQFARARLSGAQFGVLKMLEAAEVAGSPGLTMSELSDRLCVSRPNTTGLVDRLLGRGLVERSGASDRRQVRVDITDEGRRVVAEMTPHAQNHAARLVDGLAPAERSTLAELLMRLRNQALAVAAGDAGPGPPEPAGNQSPAGR